MGVTTTIIPQQIDLNAIVDNDTIKYDGVSKKIYVDKSKFIEGIDLILLSEVFNI